MPRGGKHQPPTEDMVRVLRRMQAGEEVKYGTSTQMSGRCWFSTEAYIRQPTVIGLLMRGLVEHHYKFPVGELKLTKKGREFDLSAYPVPDPKENSQ